MSNDIEHYTDPQDSAVALYLTNNDGEELTNVLVAALEDAFRILRDEVSGRNDALRRDGEASVRHASTARGLCNGGRRLQSRSVRWPGFI